MTFEIITLCLLPFLIVGGFLVFVVAAAALLDVTHRIFGGGPSGIFGNSAGQPEMQLPTKILIIADNVGIKTPKPAEPAKALKNKLTSIPTAPARRHYAKQEDI